MFDDDGVLESLNDEAEAWLRELPATATVGKNGRVSVVPTEIVSVAARARAISTGLEPGKPTVPPHAHAGVEEALYVADGEIELTAERETYAAPTGTFALVPRGIPHSYTCKGDRAARVVAIVSPPQLDPYLAEAFPEGGRP